MSHATRHFFLALLTLCLGPRLAIAQPPRCPPGQTAVELREGPGTPMVPYRVRVTPRCLTPRQLARLRGPYSCHRADRRGVVSCVALVPQMAPLPDTTQPRLER